MKKNRGTIILIIMLVIYQVVAFASPFEKNSNFWQAYIFAIISMILTFLCIRYTYKASGSLQSKFYHLPIMNTAFISCIIEVVFSILFMACGRKIPIWIETLFFVIVLGFTLTACIAEDKGADFIQETDKKGKQKTIFITMLIAQINSICNNCSNNNIKGELEELQELIRYSDPVSNKALTTIETALQSKVDELESVIGEKDEDEIRKLIAVIKRDLDKRNTMCKMTK